MAVVGRFEGEVVRVEREQSSRVAPLKKDPPFRVEVEVRSPDGAVLFTVPGETDRHDRPVVGDRLIVEVRDC